MPLSKQAKALYEAALRRKGLQPGKAVRQDPRTFVGPIQIERNHYYGSWGPGGWVNPVDEDELLNTYHRGHGRLQDIEDELVNARLSTGDNRVRDAYHLYYDSGIAPKEIRGNDFTYKRYGRSIMNPRRDLTTLGKLELEARMDEMIENEYKKYLRAMYEGRIPVQPGYSAEDLLGFMR